MLFRSLMMYGQMTAGSWIYIGTQGILQGTYETFGSLARQHGWGNLAGKLVLTAGLGEMGGAQPQAVTFNGGVGIFVEVDPWRIERRLALKQIDVAATDLDDAIAQANAAVQSKQTRSHCSATLRKFIGRCSISESSLTSSPIKRAPTIRYMATFLLV